MARLVTPHRSNRCVVMALALATLASCGARENKPATTQVVARVDGDEITVHQINAVLAQNPNLTPEGAASAKREILDRLIDQKVAAQQALRRQLDRSPKFLLAMEASRADILARALLEELARAQPRPSPEETRKYYAAHPELFSQRREFVLESISFAASTETRTELQHRVAKAVSMKAIAEWLKSRNVDFSESQSMRGAEEVPLPMLPWVHAMKDGEIQLIDEGGGRFQVIRLAASRPAPMDEATATPRIQQFLFNRALGEAIDREMKQLKSAARIEFLGEFAADAAAATAGAKVKTRPQTDPPQLPARSVEKGVRSLR